MILFKDRADAGRKLAQELPGYGDRTDVIVLGLPRGGVPVAFEVAKALKAPLDIFLVRKLGAPGQEELAMGAIAPGGVRVLNHNVVQALNISDEIIETIAAGEQQELERREQAYRGDRPKPDVRGRTLILVDDGLATGASMRAAVIALRRQEPAGIIVAVPTAAAETCEALKGEVDEIVCVATPQPFLGIGASYEEFSQMTDEEVRELIEAASSLLPAG
jgi:putative phosphoribosyl transferase